MGARFMSGLLLSIVCLSALAGCGSPVRHRVGEAVRLKDGATVTLLGVTATAPRGARAAPAAGAFWLAFDVANSTDASFSLPGTPRSPELLGAQGSSASVDASTVRLTGGGGLWGPAAKRGGPYLNPRGVMRAVFEVGMASPPHPLIVGYAPTGGERVEFLVP